MLAARLVPAGMQFLEVRDVLRGEDCVEVERFLQSAPLVATSAGGCIKRPAAGIWRAIRLSARLSSRYRATITDFGGEAGDDLPITLLVTGPDGLHLLGVFT